MLIPLSWLKEYVDIKLPFPKLAESLSAAGLTVEKWEEKDGEIIFDPEVTPNRPDWMSVYGIAREIAAITNSKLQIPNSKQIPKPKNKLEIKIKPNFAIIPRMTSVIIKDVTVKLSPEWLQKKIKQIGLRPINNLVDITNYVLWLYASPLHVFDYDKIRGHQISVELSRGGEDFRSLDGLDYKLPKNAIIIKDVGRVIDLPPLKGGENTAVSGTTKNVLLHSVVCDPILTRRASQALNLRSDSSAVAERGADPNGTIPTVHKALELILELAGGEAASEILDHKEKDFKPWTVELNHDRLEKVLGIKISSKEVTDILERLGIKNSIPTFRQDIQIEEDLIEEVGRIYGYNNFPKTLPASAVPTTSVAYKKDYDSEYAVKQILVGAGYSEIYSYSLVSEDQLIKLGLDPLKSLRVDNPISRDYEYLRPTLLGNLLDALKLNQENFSEIKLFELGKEYQGESIDKATEKYWLHGIISGEKFYEAKGLVEKITGEEILLPEINLNWLHPGRQAIIKNNFGFLGEVHPNVLARFGIKNHAACWGINYDLWEKTARPQKKFQQISKFPAIVEDLSLIIPEKILYGEVLKIIKTSSLIESVELIDVHENSKTLRLTYLNKNKNLTDQEVAEERNKILKNLKEKLGVSFRA